MSDANAGLLLAEASVWVKSAVSEKKRESLQGLRHHHHSQTREYCGRGKVSLQTLQSGRAGSILQRLAGRETAEALFESVGLWDSI